MVVRLVRAGVGALLLLIAVPLALAGGGLWVAMEHRAADDTFAARLERLRSGGRAVVVPDIDALLRADAPFARGGQTTLSLSAVGSSGPLFIGLAPDAAVQRYLDGQIQARVSRVRLARGPLPVEANEVQTRAAAATAAQPGSAGPVANGPAVQGPAATGNGTAGPGDPNAGNPGTDPGANNPTAGNPDAGNPADSNAGSSNGTGDANAAGDPGATGGDPNATGGPNGDGTMTAGPNAGPNATTSDPNTTAGDPNTTTAGPNAGNPGSGNPGSNPGSGNPGGAPANGSNVVAGGPAGQEFWLAKSVTVGGAARLTWSPSALRGRHLALVVMNADGTAGIDAAVTARLAPAWIGPTAGGLLMLGTALFLLALLVLAWPPRRAEERLVLPALPTQPTKSRPRVSLRRTLSEPIAALLNPVVPKRSNDSQTTAGVVVTEVTPSATAAPEAPDATVETDEAPDKASENEPDKALEQEPGTGPEREPEATAVATVEVAAEAAPEAVAVDETAPVDAVGDEGEGVAVQATQQQTGQAGADGALAESELDRPAPVAAIDDDEPGPVILPPLPKLPPIELQFTWAPVDVDEKAGSH